MIQPETKTSKKMRVAIFCIAVLMLVSTLALYFMIIVQDGNDRRDQAALEKIQEEYEVLMNEHDDKVKEKAAELSKTYYKRFVKYKSNIKAFNAKAVTALKTKDIVKGSGATVKAGTKYSAYYYAWLPSDKIFDSSVDADEKDRLLMPITSGPVYGWDDGIKGMKIGGVREITFPADAAYGEEGSKDLGVPADTPVKYIVMLIEQVESIPYDQKIIPLCTEIYKSTYGSDAELLCKMSFGGGLE